MYTGARFPRADVLHVYYTFIKKRLLITENIYCIIDQFGRSIAQPHDAFCVGIN
jgi:hypothetical protein